MRAAVVVVLLLAPLSVHAASSVDVVPLKEAHEVEELNVVGNGLMQSLGAEPTSCPSNVVERAFRFVSVLFCGATTDASSVDDLTTAIDDYMLTKARVRATDAPWTKKRKFMVREYSIGGFAVTVHAAIKHHVIVMAYQKQCFPSTLPPPEEAGEIVTKPSLDQKEVPQYPIEARKSKAQGDLVFQLLIRADGTIGDLCLIYNSQPGMGFEESAVNAIRKWRYKPARVKGEPVEVPFTVFVSFHVH